MNCKNCGAELEPGANYCQDCGQPVADGAAPRSVKGQPAQTSFKPAEVKTGKRRPSAIAVAVATICVAAIIAVGFGAATLLGMRSGSSSDDSAAASQAVAESGSGASQEASDAGSSAASSSEASSSASSAKKKKKAKKVEEPSFDKVEAEKQAREDAQDAGMQVLMGTIHVTTYGQRAAEVNSRLSKNFASVAGDELVLLEFSMTGSVSAADAGNMGYVETRSGQECISLSNTWDWEDFDGQLVTVAAYPEDLVFPADVAGMLFSAYGNAEMIAPLNEQRAASLTFARQGAPAPLPEFGELAPEPESKSKSSASAKANGDYVLADSATHAYTRSELSGLSDYELFIARNEIYARHGRRFQSADLQGYFDSKSWYKGTSSPSAFDEGALSATELANIQTIREVEQSRNSKYV